MGRFDLLTARVRPWMVLGPLVVVGWLVAAFVARHAIHTGPVYYNGGDGTWYYTTAWMLGHEHIPYSSIGYAYPMLLAPLARIGGANIIAGLPYAIALNVLVLGPVALFAVYGISKLIAGRRFAYLVTTIWALAPLLAIPYFVLRYHRRYVGETLPAVLGLTTLGDFPSMVVLLVAAYFGLRAMLGGRGVDALTCGLLAGIALAVKPANGAFLPALVIGFVVARRPRAMLIAAAGLVPSLICLAIWKDRGVGYIPLLSSPSQPVALGPGPLAFSLHTGGYLRFNWHTLTDNIDGLREYTWSKRMIEWSVVGGAIALTRRSSAGAAFLAAWLAAFMLLKGGTVATVKAGSFFRYMAPAFPAAFLLAVALPLLIPIAGRRLAGSGQPAWPTSDRSRRRFLGIAVFLSIAPIVPLLAFPVQASATAASLPDASLFVPANRFVVHAVPRAGGVALSWPSQSVHGARLRYAIFRSSTDLLTCNHSTGGAMLCYFPILVTHYTKNTHWLDPSPGPGRQYYRVLAASSVPGPTGVGDAILISRMATANVRKAS